MFEPKRYLNTAWMKIFQYSTSFSKWSISKFSLWLLKEEEPHRKYLCDFNHICDEVRPCDVLLIEGRNRISHMVRNITHSPWSHAVLYIGKLSEIKDSALKKKIKSLGKRSPNAQLIIESEIGVGTVINLLSKYKDDHIRLLRPQGLSSEDAQKIIEYAVSHFGASYDLRHLFDLARFLMPWGLFPRRWRSSLFEHNALQPTKDICSSMIAEAFQAVNFPILPMVTESDIGLTLMHRNPKLYTPSDFDYSPYFAVIKYPLFPLNDRHKSSYLPWRDGISNER